MACLNRASVHIHSELGRLSRIVSVTKTQLIEATCLFTGLWLPTSFNRALPLNLEFSLQRTPRPTRSLPFHSQRLLESPSSDRGRRNDPGLKALRSKSYFIGCFTFQQWRLLVSNLPANVHVKAALQQQQHHPPSSVSSANDVVCVKSRYRPLISCSCSCPVTITIRIPSNMILAPVRPSLYLPIWASSSQACPLQRPMCRLLVSSLLSYVRSALLRLPSFPASSASYTAGIKRGSSARGFGSIFPIGHCHGLFRPDGGRCLYQS